MLSYSFTVYTLSFFTAAAQEAVCFQWVGKCTSLTSAAQNKLSASEAQSLLLVHQPKEQR